MFLASVVLHALVVRFRRSVNRVVSFLCVGCFTGGVLLIFLAGHHGFLSAQVFGAAMIYGFICELYLFLFTFALSSISANLLVTLHRRRLTDTEIESLYDSRRMVSHRIERLEHTGLLQAVGDRYEVTRRGRRFLRLLGALRGFFRHDDESGGVLPLGS
jgi:membrane protein implicated in regulation of membrane protease activity